MKKSFKFAAAAGFLALTGSAFAGSAADWYKASGVDARLNVSVKSDTDVVHFVRDTADPNVITKTYILKYADPYELRTYLRKIVQTRRVTANPANIKAIKYSDGTSILLISAEDYRFEDQPGVQGFDTIIKELDRPKITASSGRPAYLYAPKFGKASELIEQVKRVGANVNDGTNTLGATDAMAADDALNMILFKTAPFSCKAIADVLAEYDRPTPEVRAKVTVYELYAENDTKLGLDFQAWKNNDGIDLFSAGGRFMRNYSPNGADLVRGGKWNDLQYFNFNPKWNTKYIDFLTSKGKAKVVVSSEIVLTNNKPGIIKRTNEVFVAAAAPVADDAKTVTAEYGVYEAYAGELLGLNFSNKEIKSTDGGIVTITRQADKGGYQYIMRSDAGFTVDGADAGNKVYAQSCIDTVAFDQLDVQPARGNTIDVAPTANEFGFMMKLTPTVTGEATLLNVDISNRSLIGYTSDGAPRIQEDSSVQSTFTISNKGTKLVIGGVEKRDVVRVSGGIPILKDLPVIGWIFSTESESTKRSQLLVVAEVLPVKAGETFSDAEKKALSAADAELKKAGETNSFGYRQYLLDR